MTRKRFAELADKYINSTGRVSNNKYRWTLLVQAILEDPETRSKLNKFEWSDSEIDLDAIGEQGDELNHINGVPFVVAYVGNSSHYLITIIYHDGERFQVYFADNADTFILNWTSVRQSSFILHYVAKFINNWQII